MTRLVRYTVTAGEVGVHRDEATIIRHPRQQVALLVPADLDVDTAASLVQRLVSAFAHDDHWSPPEPDLIGWSGPSEVSYLINPDGDGAA